MSVDTFFKHEVVTDTMAALIEQGKVWTATRRELAIADAGSLDVLIDVASSYFGRIEIHASGQAVYDFLSVTSHTVGLGNSLDAFNNNTFFQASQSGNFSTDFLHTASYEVSAARFQGMVADIRNFDVILGPGQYAVQVQNLSGGAIDVAVQFTFAEPEIPNAP